MPLYAGVWYAGIDFSNSTRESGLYIDNNDLIKLARSAPGVPITWEHSAMDTIKLATPGGERGAVARSGKVIGAALCSWIDKYGFARIVFRIDGPSVIGLLDTGILSWLSATHVVGTTTLVEVSLTRTPARRGCTITGRITDVATYIAAHPPLVETHSHGS